MSRQQKKLWGVIVGPLRHLVVALFQSNLVLTILRAKGAPDLGTVVVSLSLTVTLCCGLLATLLHTFEQISFLAGFADSLVQLLSQISYLHLLLTRF